jgi:hypothetical protein
MDSIENYKQKVKERHIELSVLAMFPPITVDPEGKFVRAFQKAEQDLFERIDKHSEDGNYGAVVLEEPFAEVEKQFKEELDEARLYLKRYGNTGPGIEEAIAAYKKT